MLYGIPIAIRNWLYDKGILKSTSFGVPTVVVGNLCAGGTGKSPHTIWVAEHLSQHFKVAVLSRGYGRKSIGFREVQMGDTAQNVGDEPLMIKQSFNERVRVFVDAKRVRGMLEIAQIFPEVQVVVLDDAFQHRSLKGGFNILLSRAARPFYKDFLLPTGRLREYRKGFRRSDAIIFTKVSKNDKTDFKQELINKYPKVSLPQVFTSSLSYGKITSFDSENQFVTNKVEHVVLVTGIAFTDDLKEHLEENFKVTHLGFRDHHHFTTKDLDYIHKIFDKLADSNKRLVTTAKDAVKLKPLIEKHQPDVLKYWSTQLVEPRVSRENELLDLIENYVRENQ